MHIPVSTFLFKGCFHCVGSTINGILLQKTCKLNIYFWHWFLDESEVVGFKTFIINLILKLRFSDLYVPSPSACLEPRANSTKLPKYLVLSMYPKVQTSFIKSVKNQQGFIRVCNEMELSHVTARSYWFSINTKSTCKVHQQHWFYSEIDWWFVVKYPVEIFLLTFSS